MDSQKFNITNIDNDTLFWYVSIFVLITFAFSQLKISMSTLYGTIISFVTIHLLYTTYNISKTNNKIMSDQKKDLIIPHSENINSDEKLVNLLFNMQDFYSYNPQAYENAISDLDKFLNYYSQVKNFPETAGTYFDNMNDLRRNILNEIHSIIYKLPQNVQYTEKLNKSISIINDVLFDYLDKVKYINDKYIFENGYSYNSKQIHTTNVVPYNTFSKNETNVYELD